MTLNNLPQSFCVWWEPNTFYPAVSEIWLPILRRSGLPYLSIEDFMNSCIQSFDFPAINGNPKEQQLGLYKVNKRPGYAMDQLMDKAFTLTFKLTESYISYFVMRQQFDQFLSLQNVKDLYLPNITVSLLDDAGMETIAYVMHQLTITSISNLSLSYAARLGSFNTFTVGFTFNYFDIYYRGVDGSRILLTSSDGDKETQYYENLRNLVNNKNQ